MGNNNNYKFNWFYNTDKDAWSLYINGINHATIESDSSFMVFDEKGKNVKSGKASNVYEAKKIAYSDCRVYGFISFHKSLLEHINEVKFRNIKTPSVYKKLRDFGKLGDGFYNIENLRKYGWLDEMFKNRSTPENVLNCETLDRHKEIILNKNVKNMDHYKKLRRTGEINKHFLNVDQIRKQGWENILFPDFKPHIQFKKHPSIEEHLEIIKNNKISSVTEYRNMRRNGEIHKSLFTDSKIYDMGLENVLFPNRIKRKRRLNSASIEEHKNMISDMKIENIHQYKIMIESGKIDNRFLCESTIRNKGVLYELFPNHKK